MANPSTTAPARTPASLLEEARSHSPHSPARIALLLEALVVHTLAPSSAPRPSRSTPSSRKTNAKPTPDTETDAT